jgi:hypothetical protein
MTKRFLTFALAVSVVAVAGPAAAQSSATDAGASSPGPAASGSGKTQKIQYRSESAQVNNATTAFVTAIADTVVLNKTGCILTQFHSEIGIFPGPGDAVGGRSGQFRTLIGGVLGEGHSTFGQVFVSPDGNANGLIETEGYNSWRCNLPPGAYSIIVQFAPFDAGQTMAVRGRTLVTQWFK